VTLVGDAAHPMTPNQGQGACQALDDAVALGGSVARADMGYGEDAGRIGLRANH
jgi:2-polyprenyl-6-methoxyphenol hydroxylase-like FAD-dependent oxidoreductase